MQRLTASFALVNSTPAQLNTGVFMDSEKRILIANRGEIGIRVARTCADMNLKSVDFFTADDRNALHARRADNSHLLGDSGVRPLPEYSGPH